MKGIVELTEEGQDTTVALLSRRVQLSPATVSRIVDRLVAAGLLVRERSQVDRRRVQLSLSDRGRARFVELPPLLEQRAVDQLRALTRDRQHALLDALNEISVLVGATCDLPQE